MFNPLLAQLRSNLAPQLAKAGGSLPKAIVYKGVGDVVTTGVAIKLVSLGITSPPTVPLWRTAIDTAPDTVATILENPMSRLLIPDAPDFAALVRQNHPVEPWELTDTIYWQRANTSAVGMVRQEAKSLAS
jgi:hypothetical protein